MEITKTIDLKNVVLIVKENFVKDNMFRIIMNFMVFVPYFIFLQNWVNSKFEYLGC